MPVSKNRRRKSRKKASPARRKPPAPAPLPSAFAPGRLPTERIMIDLTGEFPIDFPGGGDEGALRRAQDLVYDALETGTARERVRLARKALALSDLCADAHVLLAENAARTIVEAHDHYRRGVAAGEKALGPETFERDAGHFWALLETRPYMRARAGLADCLWALGEHSAAIGHYREMLRLNPHDNQGLRHVLTSWLFTIDDLDALEDLLAAYDRDAFVEWAYAKVLLALRKGDRADAGASLAIAWKRNPHVPGLMIGARPLPRRLPDHYAMKSREEAVVYVLQYKENWSATPGALEWLSEAVSALPPPERKRR